MSSFNLNFTQKYVYKANTQKHTAFQISSKCSYVNMKKISE